MTHAPRITLRPGQQNKLASGPAIVAPDEHDQLVKADQRLLGAR